MVRSISNRIYGLFILLVVYVFCMALAIDNAKSQDIQEPPREYLAIGLDLYNNTDLVSVSEEPPNELAEICAYYGDGELGGCTYTFNNQFYIIFIIHQDYVSEFRWCKILEHELGHVGGWPSYHPLNISWSHNHVQEEVWTSQAEASEQGHSQREVSLDC